VFPRLGTRLLALGEGFAPLPWGLTSVIEDGWADSYSGSDASETQPTSLLAISEPTEA